MGAIVVYVFFSVTDTTGNFVGVNGAARWTDVAAITGIVSVAVALLMIGGEFDLSAGVMIGTSGPFAGLLIREYDVGVWPAIGLTSVFAALIGFISGWVMVTTGLPSFINILSVFFSRRGFNLGVTKLLTDTVRVADVDQGWGFESAKAVFPAEIWQPYGFKMAVV